MKIVKFRKGHYGVRKGWRIFGYRYLDLEYVLSSGHIHWRGWHSQFFGCCLGPSEDYARKALARYNEIKGVGRDYGEPI